MCIRDRDINGHLISQHRDEKDWFRYTLTFRQVLAYFACELEMCIRDSLPTVTLSSTTGNELLEVWYYGDLLTVKGEPQFYIIDLSLIHIFFLFLLRRQFLLLAFA